MVRVVGVDLKSSVLLPSFLGCLDVCRFEIVIERDEGSHQGC
jgi:hypothetical protein